MLNPNEKSLKTTGLIVSSWEMPFGTSIAMNSGQAETVWQSLARDSWLYLLQEGRNQTMAYSEAQKEQVLKSQKESLS